MLRTSWIRGGDMGARFVAPSNPGSSGLIPSDDPRRRPVSGRFVLVLTVLLLSALALPTLANPALADGSYALLHVRRHLAWTADGKSRLRAELLIVGRAPATLSLHLVPLRGGAPGIICRRRSRAVDAVGRALLTRSTVGEGRLAQAVASLVRVCGDRLKRAGVRSVPRLSRTAGLPLTALRAPLPGQQGLWLVYLPRRNDYGPSLQVAGRNPKDRYLVVSSVPLPKAAMVGHIACDAAVDRCLVELEYRPGRSGGSRSTLEMPFRPSRARSRILNMVGYRLHDKKRFVRALAAFRGAAQIDPSYGDPIYNTACALARLGRRVEALAWLKRAIKKDRLYRKLAAKDKDFKSLWKDREFRGLVGRRKRSSAQSTPRKVKKKVEPTPGSDSTQIRPP